MVDHTISHSPIAGARSLPNLVSTNDPNWIHAPLDRASPLPLYAQIKQRLITMILNWNRDDRFYSDEQLCALFRVSRDTIRQAVAELVQAGVLTRSRGLGTFVVLQKVEERFNPAMDLLQQWAAHGAPLQMTPLVFERRAAPPEIAQALALHAGAPVLFIKRLRTTATVPIAIDYRYLPLDLAGSWTEEAATGSPLHVLWQTVDIAAGEFAIEAALAGPDEVEYLHVPAGAPVLIRTLRYHDHAGRFVLAGHTVHRADLVRYSLTVPLCRDQNVEGPAYDTSGVHDD
jgi:GntR family transcriptional regulator